jgi:basic amino acid/polyamine antiporter, APA family
MSTAATPAEHAAGDGGLFTRQASGLVREIGVPAAVGMSIGSVACLNLLIAFPGYTAAFERVDFYVPILGGALVWLVAMLAYRHLVQAIPRAGGEYVYVSRVISPLAGALAGIATALILIFTLAANVNLAAVFTPFMFTALGDALGSAGIAGAADDLSTQAAVALLSAGILLVVGVAVMLSLKRLAQIVLGMVLLQLVAFAVLAFLLLTKSNADFARAFASYSDNPGAYEALIQAGQSNGVAFGVGFGAMIALLPVGVLAYNGVLYSYYLAGELRKPGRTYVLASSISIGVLLLVWGGIWLLMRKTAGLDFMQAQTNLNAIDPDAYARITSLDSGIGALGYGLVLSGDPISKILIGLAVPLASIGVALTFTAVVARVLLALAFDRMLPISIAKVSQRNHAPVAAIAIAILLSLGFCLLLSYTDVTAMLSLLSLFLVLVVLFGGIAATCIAHRRPDLVTPPGETEIPRWSGLPRSTWAGLATTALALFMIVEIVVHRDVYLVLDAVSITSLLVVLLAGPVVYLIARAIRRQRSEMDLSMAMRELPPE